MTAEEEVREFLTGELEQLKGVLVDMVRRMARSKKKRAALGEVVVDCLALLARDVAEATKSNQVVNVISGIEGKA